MGKQEDKMFNNKNGYYTEEELLEFKHMTDEEFINFLRKFNIKTCKCPPLKYKTADCFFCINCMKFARELVKEKKVK